MNQLSNTDLSHGGEESLRVEEARHPEGLGSAAEQPHLQLRVPLQQLREPETQRARVPRDLDRRASGVRTQLKKLREPKIQRWAQNDLRCRRAL